MQNISSIPQRKVNPLVCFIKAIRVWLKLLKRLVPRCSILGYELWLDAVKLPQLCLVVE